ncbi:hypothetical protein QZH56_13290 [Streptomyces olivoreticuli]|uniref:Membrane protein n=1 Tax=Streptomyces blastmyceticus TaxID=68180 RepID=A0ABN0WC78_9ACTN|nr:hypothetical protein [Streptomyces olivoreticuli]WKK26471.1 hypothetical protein QZH56_13290 [Streptomyces olivoreticuli]
MGIESDQLVFDYLSRVGDIAQRTALTSADRMRLVSRLRTEIERRRSSEGADSPAAVQRILSGLGTPDEAVADANGFVTAETGRVPAQRREDEPARTVPAAAPPHLATPEELSPSGEVPDWWRVDPGPFGKGEAVHGFVGGIEVPEILKPPPREPVEAAPVEAAPAEPEEEAEEAGETRRRPSLLRRPDGEPVSVLLLLVALVLLVGAVLGNWFVLAGGWALAYLTRKLSHTESQWAVMGVPGLTLAAWAVWLWGRTEGRWGTPVPEGGLGTALSDSWPWTIRAAAVASALYVIWRSRRPG